MIKNLGNYQPQIEVILNSCRQEKNNYFGSWWWIYSDFCSKFLSFFGNEMHSSFYCQSKDDDLMGWHVDGATDYTKDTIICGYPTPTQVLIPIDYNVDPAEWQNAREDKNDIVQNLIDNKKIELFTLELGCVYKMPNKTIHRTNPSAVGREHLVLRTQA